MMVYYATWRAHGTTFQSKQHATLEAAELEVFGIAFAPQRDAVTFWQVLKESTD
tara:strand:- start:270 stop:431 length:162 start_codon:yes stop_codon:yes gene_type:complete